MAAPRLGESDHRHSSRLCPRATSVPVGEATAHCSARVGRVQQGALGSWAAGRGGTQLAHQVTAEATQLQFRKQLVASSSSSWPPRVCRAPCLVQCHHSLGCW